MIYDLFCAVDNLSFGGQFDMCLKVLLVIVSYFINI